jgi:hypothetical protein
MNADFPLEFFPTITLTLFREPTSSESKHLKFVTETYSIIRAFVILYWGRINVKNLGLTLGTRRRYAD